jgi:hypothetical protein
MTQIVFRLPSTTRLHRSIVQQHGCHHSMHLQNCRHGAGHIIDVHSTSITPLPGLSIPERHVQDGVVVSAQDGAPVREAGERVVAYMHRRERQ